MSLCVPCAHMPECIPYRDTMRNSVKMSKKRSAKQKGQYYPPMNSSSMCGIKT